MSEAALLRPGIATGSYPEREDERESWLDRTASRHFRCPLPTFRPQHLDRGFLRQVARASEGLERLTAHELSEMVTVFCVAICTATVCGPIWWPAPSR